MRLQLCTVVASMAAAAAAAATSAYPSCTSGVVVFAVRGSDFTHTTLTVDPAYTDVPPPISTIASSLMAAASPSGGYLKPIAYPAIDPTPPYTTYQESVDMGIEALQSALHDYVGNCSAGQIFILGHSQGASVISGALGGNKDGLAPLSASISKRSKPTLTGVTITADPTFINGFEPLDQGNSFANNGTASDNNNPKFYNVLNSTYNGRMRSYCQAGDEYCDSGTGSNAGDIHNDSPAHFQAKETSFLLSLLKKA